MYVRYERQKDCRSGVKMIVSEKANGEGTETVFECFEDFQKFAEFTQNAEKQLFPLPFEDDGETDCDMMMTRI